MQKSKSEMLPIPHKRYKKVGLAKKILTLGLETAIVAAQTLSGLATPITADRPQEMNSQTELLVEALLRKKSGRK